jgi:hypothetical protein
MRDQAPHTGDPPDRLTQVRQALDALAQQEYRLEHHHERLGHLLARSEEKMAAARRLEDELLLRDALARRQQLLAELERLEAAWERLHARRTRLLQHEARLLREGTLPDALPLPAVGFSADVLPGEPFMPGMQRPLAAQPDELAPPAAPWGKPEAAFTPPDDQPENRTEQRLRAMLGVLALVVLLVPLVLLALRPQPAAVTQPISNTQPGPSPTDAPVQAPVFTPSSATPTSTDCRDNVSFPCYSPEQMHGAFHLNALYKQGYDGRGQTIVIIGAGHTTTLKQDLHQFDLGFGLPDPPSFQILQPQGAPVPYACPAGFDELEAENTLDVEWSHAMAPGANIVLLIWTNGLRGRPAVQNCSFVDLEGAVAYALDHQLGQVISMSYGIGEVNDLLPVSQRQPLQPSDYAGAHEIFQRAAAQHVTVLSASGDTGAINNGTFLRSGKGIADVSWPASDPGVLAVGGTSIQISDANGTVDSEQVWNDQNIGATGGGLSLAFAEPDYQKLVPDQHLLQGRRGVPDVAFPAALSYALYLSSTEGLGTKNPQWRHWTVTGGTSASAPCWAGIIALANQMAGKPLGLIQPALYHLHGQGMRDITQGNNSFFGVPGYSAQPGYDLATGWGTPLADQLLPALVKQATG